MTKQVSGTVENGMVRVEIPLALPENTPVRITVEPVVSEKKSPHQALADLFRRLEEHPIHGGGKKFNRDELYDRI